MRKSGSAEKLGLTVCYSSGSGSEDADTEVYISEIVPESLAARDGRLREGDQILRVKARNTGFFFPFYFYRRKCWKNFAAAAMTRQTENTYQKCDRFYAADNMDREREREKTHTHIHI